MDTSDPDILFDADGHCNHCTDFLVSRARFARGGEGSEETLRETIARVRAAGRGRRYDCIVGISGGVDSCYALYLAKKRGLRPLAVHMDNGWNSDIAVRNIKRVADGLGVDYESYVLEWNEFRDLQLAFLKASVPEMETPTDIAIPASLHDVAARYGVRYIIAGGNYATEGILPKSWHYDARDLTYLKAIHARFGKVPLRRFPTFGYARETYYKIIKRTRFVYMLNMVRYSKRDATERLKREFGWTEYSGKHHESRFTRFVQSYILPTKFNIDYRRATLSPQICTNEISRADALAILQKPPFDAAQVASEKEYVAKKFEITIDELERILALPPKTFRDYPNDHQLLETIYSVYRRFFAPWVSIASG
jgi:N-acetyl sugar amidotransferase